MNKIFKPTICNQIITKDALECQKCGQKEPLLLQVSVEFHIAIVNAFLTIHNSRGCNNISVARLPVNHQATTKKTRAKRKKEILIKTAEV
jgi:hypothetical protein